MVIIPVSAQDETSTSETAAETNTQGIDETTLILNTGDQTGAADTGEVDFQAITISDLLRIILVLLMVIAAIYLVLYILKKFSTTAIDGSSLINIVGSKGLMKDSAVHLLEVGNQVFLVGSGNSSVNLISEITDQETIDNIRLNLSKDNIKKKGTFASIIAGQLGNNRKKKAEDQIRKTELFLKNQRDRLKDL